VSRLVLNCSIQLGQVGPVFVLTAALNAHASHMPHDQL